MTLALSMAKMIILLSALSGDRGEDSAFTCTTIGSMPGCTLSKLMDRPDSMSWMCPFFILAVVTSRMRVQHARKCL